MGENLWKVTFRGKISLILYFVLNIQRYYYRKNRRRPISDRNQQYLIFCNNRSLSLLWYRFRELGLKVYSLQTKERKEGRNRDLLGQKNGPKTLGVPTTATMISVCQHCKIGGGNVAPGTEFILLLSRFNFSFLVAFLQKISSIIKCGVIYYRHNSEITDWQDT